MGYKVFASMNITIIGEGKTPKVLAAGLAEAEHEIFIAAPGEYKKPDRHLLNCFDNIHASSIEDAAAASDIIIITTPAKDVREVAYRMDDVRNKIVIDASKIPYTKKDDAINTVSAIKAITGSKNVIRCFNLVGYKNLMDLFYQDNAIDLFLAGDSKKAKETVKLLARDMGYNNCFDFGDNESIPLLEDMARCMIGLSKKQIDGGEIPFKLLRK